MAKPTYLTLRQNTKTQRLLEALPGVTSWLFLSSPIILSFLHPISLAYLIIAYDLWWLAKAFGLSYRLIHGYRRMHETGRIDWLHRVNDLKDISAAIKRIELRLKRNRLKPKERKRLLQYYKQLKHLDPTQVMNPELIYQGVVIPFYNESLAIIEPTIKALTHTNYPLDKIILFIGYEGRAGKQTEETAKYLVKHYKHYFKHMEAVMHPEGVKGEIKGKGPNATHAGRALEKYVRKQKIDPSQVVVTTLDCDNRPDRNYFAYLSYVYAITPERKYRSYQPLTMYFNNIWDVPAPMRVIATGNSFWTVSEALRARRLRNFSAHAQSLDALIDTDFWSVESIVEDGHQYWRSFFAFDGNYSVVPLHIVIYQDAVLAKGYWRTFKAQFIQLRRWAYGASDIPFVIINSFYNRKIKLTRKLLELFRLYEGHFSWATASLILLLAAWAPLFLNSDFNRQSALAHLLPVIVSRIQTVAMLGLFVTIFISVISLPPRPAYYTKRRHFSMILQWVLLPVTTIAFNSLAALNAQTRLILGKRLEQFDVTEKATKQ